MFLHASSSVPSVYPPVQSTGNRREFTTTYFFCLANSTRSTSNCTSFSQYLQTSSFRPSRHHWTISRPLPVVRCPSVSRARSSSLMRNPSLRRRSVKRSNDFGYRLSTGWYPRSTSKSNRSPLNEMMRSNRPSSEMSVWLSGSNHRRKRFCASHVTATARPNRAMFNQPPSTSCDRRSVSMSKKISLSISGKRLGVVVTGFGSLLVFLHVVVDIHRLNLRVVLDCETPHLLQA